MKSYIHIFSFAILLVFSTSVMAEDTNVNDIKFPISEWDISLLAASKLDGKILADIEYFEVAAPPLNDSKETLEELAYLMEIAKTERTDDNVARIIYENDGGKAYDFFVKEGLINEGNYKTLELFAMIDADHLIFILKSKKYFSRPRPSQLAHDLELVIPNPGHPAYPSGHASQSYIVALVLADFDPANAERYKQFAVDIANRREIAGVHYPSDSAAGRILAGDVLEKLRAVPVFEKKYQNAKVSYVKPNFSTDVEVK